MLYLVASTYSFLCTDGTSFWILRRSTSYSATDIETLEKIVQRYTSKSISKTEAIGDLFVASSTICAQRGIALDAAIIHPYIDQLQLRNGA
jgi:hypothetical protein